MSNLTKTPLEFDKYQDYDIDQRYSAFVINITDIEEQQAEDFELEYTQKGYKVFNSSLERAHEGKFNLKLIIAKLEMLF